MDQDAAKWIAGAIVLGACIIGFSLPRSPEYAFQASQNPGLVYRLNIKTGMIVACIAGQKVGKGLVYDCF